METNHLSDRLEVAASSLPERRKTQEGYSANLILPERRLKLYLGGIENRLLKAGDVAHFLNISRTQAYRLMKTEIPVFRVGSIVRVCLSDLERFVDENKKNAGDQKFSRSGGLENGQ